METVNIVGKKLIAIIIFAVFVLSSIPVMAISTEQIEPVNVDMGVDTPVDLSDSDDTHVQNDVTEPEHRDDRVHEESDHSEREDKVREDHSEEAYHVQNSESDHVSTEPVRETAPRPESEPHGEPIIKTSNEGRRSETINEGLPKNPVTSHPLSTPPMIFSAPMPPSAMNTEVNGTILTQTWTLAGSPYWIIGNVTIPVNETLDIDPGVVVLFNGSYTMTVNGTLNSNGVAGNMVTFNTNILGSWESIIFNNKGISTLMYTTFSGAVDAIHITDLAWDIEVGYCDFNTIAGYGIWVDGEFQSNIYVHDSTFDTTDYAIYGDVYFLGTGSLMIGNTTFTDNTVTSPWGFYYSQLEIDSPIIGSNFVVGDITITGNTFTNSQESIYFDYVDVTAMDTGTVVWGDIIITDNDITQTGTNYGIYFYGDMYDLTDVTLDLGTCDISRNIITNGGAGIYFDYWDINYLYENTTVFCNPLNINDNDITTTSGYGIYLYWDYLGYEMYDNASLTVSDVTIDPNIVTSSSYAIYLYSDYCAYEMYDDSEVIMGDFYVTDNIVESTGATGMYLYFSENGAYMYNNAMFTVGNFYITGNDVTSSSTGIDFWPEYVGYEMYDDTQVHFGTVDLNSNTLDSANYYGISASFYYCGYTMYGNSVATFGTWNLNYNDFYGSDGLYAGPEYTGYDLNEDSSVVLGDFNIMYNTMDISGYGLDYEPYDCGETMYGNSMIYGGDSTIQFNEVYTTGSNAFYLYYDYFAYDMYDDSFASFGLMDIQWNDFTSTGDDAVYIDIYYLGAYMYDDSIGIIDDIWFMNNEVYSTSNDGIYFYEFYENGYYNEDNSYFQMGDVLVNDNYIEAGGYGIYMDEINYNGYEMYDNARADFGDMEFNNNEIYSSNTGLFIYYWYDWGSYLYDNSIVTAGHFEFNDNYIETTVGDGIYVEEMEDLGYYMNTGGPGATVFYMENIEFCRNTIDAGDYGIYLDDFYYWGYEMYYESTATIGDLLVNDNIITSVDDGIFHYGFLEFGAYMYDNSVFSIGNMEFNRNDIESGDYGIYVEYLYEFAYYMYDSSVFTAGHFQVNDNLIHSYYDGIYMEYFYENAYYMYGSSYFEMGNFEFMRNIITSDDGYGICLYDWYEWGYEMQDSSTAIFGDILTCNNVINSYDEGIYIYEWYYFGYYMYGSSYLYIGDLLFNDNDITSSDSDGIYMYWIGESANYMEDNSEMYFGDIEFNRNTIDAYSDGIYFDYGIYYVGYYNYDSSFASWGHYQLNDNIIQADYGYGIYFDDFEYVGTYMDDVSYFELGNVEIQRNVVNCSDDGIFLYLHYLGYNNDDSSLAVFGDFLFCDNVITTEDDGLYISQMNYFAYELYDNSEAYFGDFLFNNNDITADGYGIYVSDWDYWAYDMEDSTYAHFGDIEFCNNNIYSDDDGIYLDHEYWAAYLYSGDCDITVEIGHYFVNDNVITSVSDDGIYVDYFYDIGYYLGDDDYDIVHFTMGDVQFCRNTINASDYGIYVYEWYEWCYYTEGSIFVEFGDFLFNDNDILSGDIGFYIDDYMFYYFGESMDYNSHMTFGDIEFNRNTIESGSDGFYAEEYFMYDVGYGLDGSCSVTGGHFQMNYNDIDAQGYGIYLYELEYHGAYLYVNSHFSMGNSEICYNNIYADGDDGIYWGYAEYWGYDLDGYSTCTIGDFLINWNTVVSVGDDGIYLDDYYDMGYDLEGQACAYFGNVEVCNNTVTAGETGLYLDDVSDYGYELYGSNTVIFGDILFNDNYIIADTGGGGNYGIYLYGVNDCGEDMYYDSYFEMGNVEICRNYVDANLSSGYGIYVDYIEYWGYDLYDNSVAVFGDFLLNDNTILCYDDGIYLYEFYYESAYGLYDHSYAYFGDIQFVNNYIETTDGDGMYFDDMYDFGSYIYDDSHVYVGDVLYNYNEIYAPNGYGITFDDIYDWGYYMDGSSTFEMGDFNFIGNYIECYDYGIDWEPYYFGAYMYDESVAIFGENLITDNIIYTDDGYGLYVWWWYEFGYETYGNSYVEVGSAQILRNTIDSYDYGIYTGPYESGEYVYDNSRVVFGDYVTDYNIITSDSYGIEFTYYYVGYDLDGTASVEVGIASISNNQVDSYDEAIYFDYESVGYDLYDSSSVICQEIYIQDNTLTSDEYEGIYIYYYDIVYGVYDNSYFYAEDMYVSGNTITCDPTTSDGIGIYIYAYEVGYGIDGTSYAYIGDVNMYDNDILDSYNGLYIDCYDVGDSSEFAYLRLPTFRVYDSTFVSSDTAVYIDSDESPYGWYDESVQEWPDYLIEIGNCQFTDGDGMEVYSDSSTQPLLWVHDSTFTNVAGGTTYGLWAEDVAKIRMDRVTLVGYTDGIYADNSYVAAGSCTFPTFTGWDISMINSANVFMVDTTFDKTNVQYQDANSLLDIGWYLTVYTETSGGARVPFVDLEAISNNGTGPITDLDHTNALGVADMMLRESRHDQANPWPAYLQLFNDHNVTGTKSVNTAWADPLVTMDMSKSIVLIFGDGVPPTLGEDKSDLFGTTGETYKFATVASDDMLVTGVDVFYRINAGGWSSMPMTLNGMSWESTFTVPDVLGDIEHYFVATDIGGNTFTGSTASAPIYDNDAPDGYSDSTQGIIYSSTPNLDFIVNVNDNIAIDEVWLNWWYDSESPDDELMVGTGPYTYNMPIDFSKSAVNFYIIASDTSGNTFTGPVETCLISDIDMPVLVSDNSATNATTGEPYTFEIEATDNVDIVSQTVTYWFGTGMPVTAALTEGPADIYTLGITIPLNSTDSLNYFFTLEDNDGNLLISYMVGSNKTVVVVDNDAPTLVSDDSDGSATTGDVFNFMVIGDDNIDVASINVIYWYGTGAEATLSLTATGGVFSGTLNIPANSIDTLHYYLEVLDAAGNNFTQSQQNVAVTDNDEPTIGTDTSDTSVSMGDVFDFGFSASDNIGITGAFIVYWYEGGSIANVSMTGASPYVYNITIPADSTAPLNYYFAVMDAAGHWATTAVKTHTIVDLVAPVFGDDLTANVTDENADLTFSIPASDNVGIESVFVVYWIGSEGDYAYAQLSLIDGNYVGAISVPEGTILHYYFMATDTSGNTAQTPEKTITIQQDTDGDGDGDGGDGDSDADTSSALGNEWLLIAIIIILIVVIAYLLVTRNSGGAAPVDDGAEAPAAEEEVETPPPAEPVEAPEEIVE